MPSLTNVFRRRTSRLNFFARIMSAPMSFRFCADGVPVLGTVWIPAVQSKRRSSAGACVDGNWTQLSPPSHARRARSRYKVEDGWLALSNRISSSAKMSRPKRGRSRWKSVAHGKIGFSPQAKFYKSRGPRRTSIMRLASATISSVLLFSRLAGLFGHGVVEPGEKIDALQPFPTGQTSILYPL